MKRLVKVITFLVPFAMIISPISTLAADAKRLGGSGTANNPFVIDTASATPIVKEYPLPPNVVGTMYFEVINIPPSLMNEYRSKVVVKEIETIPFVRPAPQEPTKGASPEEVKAIVKSAIGGVATPPSCNTKLAAIKSALDGATSNSQVPGILANLSQVDGCLTEKQNIINSTVMIFDSFVLPNSNVVVEVDRIASGRTTNVATLTFIGKKKQWLTHTGWTLIYSRDDEYYSLKNDDGSYSIAPQNNQNSINHALSVMYSYPLWEPWNDIYIGPSGLLGLSQNGLLVGTGVSFMFTENLALNLSVVATEFERLNGVYAVGQNIGTDPLDSSSLSSKKIKASFALTIGFRFN